LCAGSSRPNVYRPTFPILPEIPVNARATLRSHWAELHRRRVLGAAAGYLVGAWVVIEVSTTILPLYTDRLWLLRALVAAAVIAFLPAMIIVWRYQWTTAGIVRDPRDQALEPGIAVVPNRIAILPFQASDADGERSADYFAGGLTEEIAAGLAQGGRFQVLARTSVDRAHEGAGSVTPLRRRLGVAFALSGSVRRARDRLRILAHLVDTDTGASLWSGSWDRTLDDALTVEREMAAEVVAALEEQLGAGGPPGGGTTVEPGPLPGQASNFDVYDRYLRGRYFVSRRTPSALQSGIATIEEVTTRDPAFALAWAALAEARILATKYDCLPPRQGLDGARNAARTALELDPRAADAHAALGSVFALRDHDWDGADRHFRRALDLNPSLTTALQWHAVDVLVPRARFDDADAALARARDLDPLSPVMWVSSAIPPFFRQDYAAAIAFCDRALHLDPQLVLARLFRGQALGLAGRHREAIAECERALDLAGGTPETIAGAGVVHALAHRTTSARRHLDQLEAIADRDFLSPDLLAHVLTALGDHDRALAALERGFNAGAYRMIYLAVDPRLDPLRGDPRFAELVTRLGT
jgi:TolB-like protein/tetratricopeptide (TPR) repeat protein